MVRTAGKVARVCALGVEGVYRLWDRGHRGGAGGSRAAPAVWRVVRVAARGRLVRGDFCGAAAAVSGAVPGVGAAADSGAGCGVTSDRVFSSGSHPERSV